MCQNLKILIEDDAWHYVGQCEHRTLHLVWGRLSLHLRPHEFVALTDALVVACLQAGPPPDSPATAFRLRLDELAMELPAEAFWKFTDLLRRAAEIITHQPAYRPARTRAWLIEITPCAAVPPRAIGLN